MTLPVSARQRCQPISGRSIVVDGCRTYCQIRCGVLELVDVVSVIQAPQDLLSMNLIHAAEPRTSTSQSVLYGVALAPFRSVTLTFTLYHTLLPHTREMANSFTVCVPCAPRAPPGFCAILNRSPNRKDLPTRCLPPRSARHRSRRGCRIQGCAAMPAPSSPPFHHC